MDEETISVVDNLISNSSSDALSAKQGRILNEKIVALQTTVNNVATDEDIDAIFAESTNEE